MNERFFDLKPDRQNQIINGALRVFARCGYAHASTDEITRLAGISKGLLFHYFDSKEGTFRFLYDYSTRFVLLELELEIRHPKGDLFCLWRELLSALTRVLARYPWMLLFLEGADLEDDPAALRAIGERRGEARQKIEDLLAGAALPAGLTEEDAQLISALLGGSARSLLRRELLSGSFTFPDWHARLLRQVNRLEGLCDSARVPHGSVAETDPRSRE